LDKSQIIIKKSKNDQMYDLKINYETKDQIKVNMIFRLPNKLNMF